MKNSENEVEAEEPETARVADEKADLAEPEPPDESSGEAAYPWRRFMGNMGEPETADEYRRKYGQYPPGFEE